MSTIPVSSPLLQNKEQVILSLRKLADNNIDNVKFLLSWYELCGEENKEFGFKNALGFGPQSDLAIEYMMKVQKDWYGVVLNYGENISFEEFFILKSKDIGLELPENFATNIKIKMEEL